MAVEVMQFLFVSFAGLWTPRGSTSYVAKVPPCESLVWWGCSHFGFQLRLDGTLDAMRYVLTSHCVPAFGTQIGKVICPFCPLLGLEDGGGYVPIVDCFPTCGMPRQWSRPNQL